MPEILIQSFSEHWPWWVGGVVVLAILSLMRMYSQPQRMPYQRRSGILTKSEMRFYKTLQKAVLDDWEIFAMVRIADLLKVDSGSRNYRSWLNKILAKHIDFVLCQPGTLEPVVCIELDDRSHQRPERIERDKFVNEAFESAELPLLRIETQPTYNARELRELIEQAL